MADDGEAFVLLWGPIEVEEVAVREFEALAMNLRRSDFAEEGGVDGDPMTPAQTEWGTVGGGDEGHGNVPWKCFDKVVFYEK